MEGVGVGSDWASLRRDGVSRVNSVYAAGGECCSIMNDTKARASLWIGVYPQSANNTAKAGKLSGYGVLPNSPAHVQD